MGLIRAAAGSFNGTMADQWKEFFVCESLEQDVLAVKGQKRTSGRSANKRGNDNLITSGSGIAVADGQCALIVEQGEIVEVCAEPGEYTYDASTEPTIFAGNLSDSIGRVFETIGKRFTYGGDTAKDQRVYYINTKELMDNKFGTPNPVPFRVVDHNIGLDVDVSVRCSGVYSYRISNPLLFYANVCGNIEDEFRRVQIEHQLKSEFVSALQPAFSTISAMEIRPNALPGHVTELCNALNAALTQKWIETRGLQIMTVAIGSITLPEEDADMIKQAQRAAILRDPLMAAATLTGAQADAMKAAAGNSAGAMKGFMGMGMATQAGGINTQNLYQMGMEQSNQMQQSQQMKQSQQNQSQALQQPGQQPVVQPAGSQWTCSCGTANTGKFCTECGKPKPVQCRNCGWKPEDANHPPKFCPECGTPFQG